MKWIKSFETYTMNDFEDVLYKTPQNIEDMNMLETIFKECIDLKHLQDLLSDLFLEIDYGIEFERKNANNFVYKKKGLNGLPRKYNLFIFTKNFQNYKDNIYGKCRFINDYYSGEINSSIINQEENINGGDDEFLYFNIFLKIDLNNLTYDTNNDYTYYVNIYNENLGYTKLGSLEELLEQVKIKLKEIYKRSCDTIVATKSIVKSYADNYLQEIKKEYESYDQSKQMEFLASIKDYKKVIEKLGLTNDMEDINKSFEMGFGD